MISTTTTTSYDPTTLQPLLSSLAQYLFLLFLLFLYYLNSHSYLRMGFDSILSGEAFTRSSIDWSRTTTSNLEGNNTTSHKGMRRKYVDTKQGREAWESANLQFPGLLNAAGNLCFLNATLQSMASLPCLIIYLDSLLTTSESLSSPFSLPVTFALYTTLTSLNTPSSRPFQPLLLATALSESSETRGKLLKSREQQDAHELWGMIRDSIEEESFKLRNFIDFQQKRNGDNKIGLNEVTSLNESFLSSSNKLGGGGGGGGGGIDNKGKGKGKGRENDPWFWLRSQRIKCLNCGYIRDTRHEGEELLMLNVPPVSNCSLYDLLEEYTRPDLLSDYACRKCSMLTTLEKYKFKRDRLIGGTTEVGVTTKTTYSNDVPSLEKEKKKKKNSKTSSSLSNRFDLLSPSPSTSETTTSTSSSTELSASKKDRYKKLTKLIEKLERVVDAGDFENHLIETNDGIKMEKIGTAAGKSVNIARTPEILLIHLNRSSHYSNYSGPIKNSCRVDFPEYLDLTRFCDGQHSLEEEEEQVAAHHEKKKKNDNLFKLSSMVVHYGSHHFGHYVAFRRRPNPPPSPSPSPTTSSAAAAATRLPLPEWYRISDETVEISTIQEVERNNPFLLFYEKLNHHDEDKEDEKEKGQVDGSLKPRIVESWRIRTS